MKGDNIVSKMRVLLLFPILKLILHLVTYRGYGMFRDEFYYLACADHLDWGYVDQPPLSIALLWIVKNLLGDSLFAVRLVPAIAGAVTVWLIGRTTQRLGGGATAQALAMLSAIVAPIYLSLNHIYSMNAIDILVWAWAGYLFFGILSNSSSRAWGWLGFALGLGLLNKISVLWLGFGFAAGLLLTSYRGLLLTRGPWMAAGVAMLLALPHVVWQMTHDWPTAEFIRNATQNKMAGVAVSDFLQEQILMMNPVTLPLWLGGLLWLWRGANGRFRPLAFTYVAIFALLVFNGTSRPGYLAPAYSWLFAAGAVAFERASARWHPRVTRGAMAISLLLSGALLAPFGLPLLPVETYIDYARSMGVGPSTAERKELAALPQFYADMHGWESVVATVGRAYAGLSLQEQRDVGIFVFNYGDAGAIDYFGHRYGLPITLSGHNNYWLWGPGVHDPQTFLVLGSSAESLSRTFASVQLAATVDCGYCMPYENGQSVWVCREQRMPLKTIWTSLRHYD